MNKDIKLTIEAINYKKVLIIDGAQARKIANQAPKNGPNDVYYDQFIKRAIKAEIERNDLFLNHEPLTMIGPLVPEEKKGGDHG